MALPMMPKATAVWLVENTVLTFAQIADFCGLHELEVQAIADDEVAVGMTGLDPIGHNQLTQAELDRCQADATARLELAHSDVPKPVARTKGARYTPVSKRQDKPDAIAWLLRFFPELADAQIGKLLGTTKPTITAVRERTHWNTQNIRPRNPVELGMCAQGEMDVAVDKAKKRVARAEARTKKAAGKAGAMPDAAMAGAATAAAVPLSANQPPAAVPLSGLEVPVPAVKSTASFVAPRPDPVAERKSTGDESVTSVFGAPKPAPEDSEAPEPTARDVFGAPKPKFKVSPAEAAPTPPEPVAPEPVAEPAAAAPEQEAAVPAPPAADEEPSPRPLPPVPGGSEPPEESGDSSESEPPAQN